MFLPGLAVLLLAGPARADGEVAARMALLAKSLTADYAVKRPGSAKVPLAVFDFACPEALEQQRVGFAVAELLKARLVDAPEFALLERSDLDRIFREQALQQTGAVDANTAVQLGKVVGAKLAVSGNVDKLGGVYQVSARLADVATGEVLAVAVQELPAGVFEQEAGRYLTLVPEEEAIGIYLGGGVGVGGSVTMPATWSHDNAPAGPVTTFTLGTSVQPASFGAGIRYLALPWLVGDLGIWITDGEYRVKAGTAAPVEGTDIRLKTTAYTLVASWTRRLGSRVRVAAGAGLHALTLSGSPDPPSFARRNPYAAGNMMGGLVFPDGILVDPLVRVGGEWRALGRLALGLAVDAVPPRRADLKVDNAPTGHLDLPVVAARLSAAVYF